MTEQLEIWSRGRDADGNITDPSAVVTHATPGSSYHNFGLAVDSCFKGNDPYWKAIPEEEAARRWSEFGRFCTVHGLTNGGTFSICDWPHAQLSFGMNLKEIQSLWKFGGLMAVFKRIDSIMGRT